MFILFLLFVFVGALFAGPLLDRIDVRPQECHIESVTKESAGGGRSSATPAVFLHSSKCGHFSIMEVTTDNQDRIYDSIQPGLYRIEVGWYSRTMHSILPDASQIARSYARIS